MGTVNIQTIFLAFSLSAATINAKEYWKYGNTKEGSIDIVNEQDWQQKRATGIRSS